MNLNCGFLKFQFEANLEKNQNNPNRTQICLETYNLFKVWYEMKLNRRFLKDQFGN